jgi:hypothetical protein
MNLRKASHERRADKNCQSANDVQAGPESPAELHSFKLFNRKRQQKCNAKESHGANHFDSEKNYIEALILNVGIRPEPLKNASNGYDRDAAPFDVCETSNRSGQESFSLGRAQHVQRWP